MMIWQRGIGRMMMVIALLSVAPAAVAQDVFTIEAVPLDEQAETAAIAREQAILAGQQAALAQLLRRLTPRIYAADLPRPQGAELANLVRDFELAAEKTSPVRYLARMTVRFKAEGVRNVLRAAGIPFAETVSKPLLVVPVLKRAGAALLWDDPNPWRDAWRRAIDGRGLVPLRAPFGDLKDITLIGAEQALAGAESRLFELAARYQAEDALVAVAEIAPAGPGGPARLDVMLTRFSRALAPQMVVDSFLGEPGESEESLLARGAVFFRDQLEERWKRDNLLDFARSGQLPVIAPVTDLADWVALRARLESMAVIDRVSVAGLTRREVRLVLSHLGDLGQLRTALAQQDLTLEETETGWRLTALGEGE